MTLLQACFVFCTIISTKTPFFSNDTSILFVHQHSAHFSNRKRFDFLQPQTIRLSWPTNRNTPIFSKPRHSRFKLISNAPPSKLRLDYSMSSEFIATFQGCSTVMNNKITILWYDWLMLESLPVSLVLAIKIYKHFLRNRVKFFPDYFRDAQFVSNIPDWNASVISTVAATERKSILVSHIC